MAGETTKKDNKGNSTSLNTGTERKSLFDSIVETKKELKKVKWPSTKELKKYTIATLFTVLFFSISIYIIDSALGFVISKLVSR